MLVTPLTEKVIDGKIKVLLCNDIVDSVRIHRDIIMFRL